MSSSNEFNKQILRINALEVQIKTLMEFEKQLRASMYGTAKGEKDGSSRNEQKNTVAKKPQQELHPKYDQVLGKEFQKVNELSRRIEKLEKIVQGINSRQYDSNTHFLSHEKENMDEKQLRSLVEQIVSEKLASQYKKEHQIDGKIRALERLISKFMISENNPSRGAIERETNQPDRAWGTTANHPREDRNEWQEESDSSSSHMRLLALERSNILVNEVQAGLLKQMGELVEKHNELRKKWEETECSAIEQNPIIKTLYIDKFYLDKYEQNNNFAQIGIHELSGALNIGATYGKEVIPKKITEEAKEEIEKMKAIKEEMVKQQTSTDQPDKSQTDESSSDPTHIPLDEEEPYTDIGIEDDPSFDKDSC